KMSSCASRQRKTGKSSRIPPQAREYISEMAEDRELERFMALSSTASSGASGSLHTCAVRVSVSKERTAGSRPGAPGHRARRPRSREDQTEEAEEAPEEALLQLPVSPTGQQAAKSMKSQENSPDADSYRIIPIVLVDDQCKSRPVAATQTMSLSVEDLRTPTKLPAEMHTKKTQTPESALKSHKRLEWDPAADVGYYKRAVSTSNISTLERSVLEECGWRQPMQQQQQRSETDLDRLQRHEGEEKTGTPMQEKTTVPLASSTMVCRQVASAGASRKADLYSSSRSEISNGSSRGDPVNSSSKRDGPLSSSKSVTSLSSYMREAPPSSSKSVASCTSKSVASFSSKSVASFSSKDSFKQDGSHISSRTGVSSRKQELGNSSSIDALQAHISSRRESLISSRRESLASNSQVASRLSSRAEQSQSSSRMGSEISSRRESQGGTSLYGSSAASSFDYHINREEELEWHKSLQMQKQKEPRREQSREPRQELRREHSHQASDQRKDPSGTDRSEKDYRQKEQRNKDQRKTELRRAEQREKELEQERQFTAAQFERVLGRRRENKENLKPRSASTSASSLHSSARAAAGPKRDLDLGIDLLCSLVEARSLSQGQKKSLVRDIARRIACLDLAETSSIASSRRERARGVPVTGPTQRQDVATNTSVTGSQSSSLKRQPPTVVSLPVPAPRKRNAEGTPSPLPSSSISAISSTSASNEVITQKTNIPTRDAASTDADVDADQDADVDVDAEPMSAIRDALTPMTQSEIEYEERMKAGMDPERRSQLNWIEAEIERLQSLKVFLAEIKDNLPNSSVPMAPDEELMISSDELIIIEPQDGAKRMEKVQTESLPKEEGRRKTSDRQLVNAVPTEDQEEDAIPIPPVRIESVRVSPRVACNLQAALPPVPPPHRYPRTKMDTPVLASHSSSSGRSESVSSFVQQRHRRFREHYQNQQQQQLLLLKQQQLQRLQQQHKHQQKQQQQQPQLCQHKHQPRTSLSFSQRHPKQHKEQHRQGQREHQQYMQMMQYDQTAASGSAYATPHSSASDCYSCADNEREKAIYYQVVNSPGASASYVQAEPVATAATTTTSASSMMGLSSEMSIPMGRINTGGTTTTTTTTHQYDDVACQRRKRRVGGAGGGGGGGGGEERMQRQTLQVRPRGIAYVIQFSPSGSGEVVPETRSLQDQLQLARPEFCAKSKQRKAILNQMQMMRNLRRREMDELVAENNGSLETLDRRLRLQLPPPATTRLRIFTTKEMKAMTTKKCQRLPEVLDAVNREVELRRRRTNRLMRDLFNKRMRNRVSNGQVSLNHSRTII
ncbi:hypothetical protein KR200_008635, partial [Drosophila serrata]